MDFWIYYFDIEVHGGLVKHSTVLSDTVIIMVMANATSDSIPRMSFSHGLQNLNREQNLRCDISPNSKLHDRSFVFQIYCTDKQTP